MVWLPTNGPRGLQASPEGIRLVSHHAWCSAPCRHRATVERDSDPITTLRGLLRDSLDVIGHSPDAAIVVVIAGDAVPSVHLHARNGSLEEIARALSLSRGTVRNHLSIAIQKLDARTRFDAGRIAEEKGWL